MIEKINYDSFRNLAFMTSPDYAELYDKVNEIIDAINKLEGDEK